MIFRLVRHARLGQAAARGDEAIDAFARIFVPLDVEGVEHAILRKLIERGLHKRIERIFVETHERQVPELQMDTDELRALIKSMNITNINLDW